MLSALRSTRPTLCMGVSAAHRPAITLSTLAQRSIADRVCVRHEGGLSVAAARESSLSAARSPLSDLVTRLCRLALLARRAGWLLMLISPLALTAPAILLAHRCFGSSAAVLDAWWDYFAWAMQTSGPTFVKLMQWAAARPDLFPHALVTRLAHVHEQVRDRSEGGGTVHLGHADCSLSHRAT